MRDGGRGGATDSVDISVVIPAHNAAGMILRQLAALGRQDWAGSWEVVIADNGSTDGTAEVAHSWDGPVPLRVVDASQRRGPSHARNVGAGEARGRFLLFVDADDVVADDWLHRMAEASRSAAFIAGPTRAVSDSGGGSDPEAGMGRAGPWSGVLPSAGFLDAAASCNMGVDRRVWQEVGGFRESMVAGEDTAFSWDVQLAGHPLVRVPGAVVRYTMRPSLRALARQQYLWGIGAAHLYALFRGRGAPRPSLAGAILRWVALPLSAPVALAGGEERRREWVGRVARRVGRVVGSMRYRVLSP